MMTAAVIVAAGQGTRMGKGTEDKLFLEVAGRPVVAHTWLRYDAAPCIDESVLVIRGDRRGAFEALSREQAWRKPFRLVEGGTERQESVWNGLSALDVGVEWVAIQDGARPCTSLEAISGAMTVAREIGAAVVAQRMTDTIKESLDGRTIARTLDRSKVWSVQTPQVFRVTVLRRALGLARERGLRLTDDTAACELIGQPVGLVECGLPNPKVTVAGDLAWVESILRGEAG